MTSKKETVLRAARLCLSGFCGYGENQCPYYPDEECRMNLIHDLVDVIEQERRARRRLAHIGLGVVTAINVAAWVVGLVIGG